MDSKIASFHGQYGGPPKGKVYYSNVVCQFWLAGKCNRNPCGFLHRVLPASKRVLPASKRELPVSNVYKRISERSNHLLDDKTRKTDGPKGSLAIRAAPKKRTSPNNMSAANSTFNDSGNMNLESLSTRAAPKKRTSPSNMSAANSTFNGYRNISLESLSSSCTEVANSNCPKDSGNSEDKDVKKPACHNSAGDWFRMLAELKGHTKGICGIALPSGSDKLYSASNDGMVHVWDCVTGRSTGTINLGEIIGCLIGEGSWVFVGLQNSIKAWNFATKKEYTLGKQNEPFGLVYAMDTSEDMLFCGAQDGSILAWKGSNDNLEPFKLVTTMKGHTATVTCLRVGGKRLYSGSTDGTIRMWDLSTLNCIHLLKKEHTDVVRSLICWDEYLLSCSLDKTIKIWAIIKVGSLEVVHSLDVKHGAIALCGIHDQENKPVLLCSCNDDCIRLFDLPSFKERGRIYSKDEVRRIEIGPDGLFFTGDGLGTLSVWKLTESSPDVVRPEAAA
ncbi:Zinc finger CCCH domain-containing protein 17 [Euphorbia peplus]|nr:Zinc finger CCCH domain-containing protein 17 [Euphorbia peplus]